MTHTGGSMSQIISLQNSITLIKLKLPQPVALFLLDRTWMYQWWFKLLLWERTPLQRYIPMQYAAIFRFEVNRHCTTKTIQTLCSTPNSRSVLNATTFFEIWCTPLDAVYLLFPQWKFHDLSRSWCIQKMAGKMFKWCLSASGKRQ